MTVAHVYRITFKEGNGTTRQNHT